MSKSISKKYDVVCDRQVILKAVSLEKAQAYLDLLPDYMIKNAAIISTRGKK